MVQYSIGNSPDACIIPLNVNYVSYCPRRASFTLITLCPGLTDRPGACHAVYTPLHLFGYRPDVLLLASRDVVSPCPASHHLLYQPPRLLSGCQEPPPHPTPQSPGCTYRHAPCWRCRRRYLGTNGVPACSRLLFKVRTDPIQQVILKGHARLLEQCSRLPWDESGFLRAVNTTRYFSGPRVLSGPPVTHAHLRCILHRWRT